MGILTKIKPLIMWEIKYFKSRENMAKWVLKNSSKYIITEIFINNGYGVEYKKIKFINI